MKLRVHGATHVGLVREHNEDSFVIDLAHGFFAVADGLGGLPGGEVASQAAVAALREQLARLPKQGTPDLGSLVAHAHNAVRVSGRPFGAEGIGTTLTAAHLAAGRAKIAHVGDSFALLVRGTGCRAITREHNIENERGLMEGTLHAPGYRYALTRVVGTPEPVRPDFFEEALRRGDRLLLATDGLTDLVELPEIAEICGQNVDPIACAGALIEAALERGGRDNITAIVIAVDDI
jgi:protein phosphatase